MALTECPLGLCDGSGFIKLIDYDGPGLHDEDNCHHVEERPKGGWTPAAASAFLHHYNTAHRFGDPSCAWCTNYSA